MSVMSLSVSAATILTDEQKADFVTMMNRADVDKDGSYSTKDAKTLLRAAAGIEPSKADYDIDLDGQVSVLDAQKMLCVASGIENVIDDATLLQLCKENLDGVKTKKPGFDKTTTMVCPSIKVTTSGAPTGFESLNVTNLEYKDYVNKFVNLMNTFPYNSLLDDEMKQELELMKQSAVDIYKPQTETKSVAATSNSHYTYFPVNNLGWACKLEISDIKGIKQVLNGDAFVVTITLDDYTYTKGQYPTGTSGFSERQKLPYGKVFNLPALDETDGSVLNSMALKNGKVVLKLDRETGKLLSVDYSYSYTSNITSAKAEGSDLVMKTVTNANTSESYVMK